jgi:hypothetical protein
MDRSEAQLNGFISMGRGALQELYEQRTMLKVCGNGLNPWRAFCL